MPKVSSAKCAYTFMCVQLKTAKMAGRLGLNGRSVPLHVEQAPSKEEGHVMPQVTPAVAPPSKPADATWENATVVVRQPVFV